MMQIDLYQVDAFASELFKGNPAAICPLQEWLPDQQMQLIAAENNLSETAFFVAKGEHFHIRWFTPVNEVNLCGHATLAAAFVLFEILGWKKPSIEFNSRSGILTVNKKSNRLQMDFPSDVPQPCVAPAHLLDAFKFTPIDCLCAEDYILVFENELQVATCEPDLHHLQQLDKRGVIVTSLSKKYDFVARFFAPKYGIPEDPVTGSAYTQLVPYWSAKTAKQSFHACQLSARSGEIFCRSEQQRVLIEGQAVLFLQGKITIGTMPT